MSQPEWFEVLVLGGGTGGKLVAWHMAQAGRRTAVVERQWIGGSCVNVACMPSKNEIANARIAHLVRHATRHGAVTGSVAVDMATVRRLKREMVERQIARHLQNYKVSGAELIMGSGRFVAPKSFARRPARKILMAAISWLRPDVFLIPTESASRRPGLSWTVVVTFA